MAPPAWTATGVALQKYTTRTVPALDIDTYAQKVYRVNRTAGL
jgi:hypothetical protein